MDIHIEIQLVHLENMLIYLNKEQAYLHILIQMRFNTGGKPNESVNRF